MSPLSDSDADDDDDNDLEDEPGRTVEYLEVGVVIDVLAIMLLAASCTRAPRQLLRVAAAP